MTKTTTLHDKYCAGPHGLGDPEDKSLRKVEKEVMIPKKMRDIARVEKCFQEVAQFSECCRNNALLMVVKCRTENSALKTCLTTWYTNEEFKNRCKDEYLKERSDYRRTGETFKQKQRIGSNM